jgi:hypothetical protein
MIAKEQTHYPPAHFARSLGTHPNTIIRWCGDGVFLRDGTRFRPKFLRLPNGYRISDADMQEFLDAIANDRVKLTPVAEISLHAKQAKTRRAEIDRELAQAGF